MLLPVLFALPLLFSLWQRRAIPRGSKVEILFDLTMPSKWAAELTQRALTAEGTSSRIYREKRQWLCSVARTMEYHAEGVAKAVCRFNQIASARGGNCTRYKVKLGRRQEVHQCELPDQRLDI